MSFSSTGSFRHGWPICLQSECGNGSEWGIVRLTIDGSMFNTHPNFKDANGIQSSIKVNPFDWAYHSHTKTGHRIKDNYDLSVDADNGKEWMMASDDSMFGALPFNPGDYNFELEDRYAQPYSQAEDRLLTRAKHIPYADKYIKRVDIILMQIPNEEDYSDYHERQEEREAFYKAINNSRFKNITHLYDSVWSLEHGKEIPKEELLGNTSEVKPLYEYVCHMKGHRNSKGELAEWVIKSHETGKILSSHKSEQKAKEHLQHMHIFGESVEGEAACSHCGWSADGVEEYNGRLLCPYCLKEFQRLDACRDANGYIKYDNITKRSDGFNPEGYKLIGESTYGTDMDKRVQIFMEGVSQLGLSKNQLEAVGNITKVCLEGQFNECWLGNTPAPQNPHIGPKDKYWYSDINREDMPGILHKGVVYELFNDNYRPISTYNNVEFSDWEHEFFELYKKAHRSEDCTISKITMVRLPNIDTSTPNPSIDFNSITPDENGNALCYQFINLDPLDGDEPRYFKSVFIPNKDRDSMGFDKWCPYQDDDEDDDDNDSKIAHAKHELEERDNMSIPAEAFRDWDNGHGNEEMGATTLGNDIEGIGSMDLGNDGDLGEIGKISEDQDEQPEF